MLLKKVISPGGRKEAACHMVKHRQISIRQACLAVKIRRKCYYYQQVDRNERVIDELKRLVAIYPHFGFEKLFALIRREGHVWNHKRVHRIYCQLRL